MCFCWGDPLLHLKLYHCKCILAICPSFLIWSILRNLTLLSSVSFWHFLCQSWSFFCHSSSFFCQLTWFFCQSWSFFCQFRFLKKILYVFGDGNGLLFFSLLKDAIAFFSHWVFEVFFYGNGLEGGDLFFYGCSRVVLSLTSFWPCFCACFSLFSIQIRIFLSIFGVFTCIVCVYFFIFLNIVQFFI